MQKRENPQELFYTVKEVAKILKTTAKTVRSYITLNQLYAHRLPNNGGYRIHRDELNRFLDGLRIG
jgi:excisionase family DNA binding protein